jgi:serine/threonine protein kinase
MGEVFRARDERLGRDVALKLIRPSSNDNPDHRRRFELEARVVSALNHPNIVAIYDVGFHNGSPYIVAELLEGQTLRKRLTEGALPVRLAVDYSSQIVQGLIAAHDRQITHRDLKPENLFLTNEGQIKILDFGLAKLQPESERSVEELTTATRAGVLVGTPSYMSPEQVRCQKVDHRSDLFSLGAILYEMLSGRRAFKGETKLDTMIAVAAKEPAKIDLEQAGIPWPLQEIVRRCLKKERENRFQSARDLAAALDTAPSASERVIGQYRILEKIGAGAMGEAFRARDERLGRDVALKLFRPASNGNRDHLRRFELEARAVAAMNHPNVVAIHDMGFDNGALYIVCELLEGQTLRERLTEGALPVRLTVDYSSQIVQGLIAAHRRHIIHRDLRPENLLLTFGRVKIFFGAARLQFEPAEYERSVEELTPSYMSPEQMRGKKVDQRSDIFSVGAILYEMLTGHRAFQGETEVDTMTAVLLEDPPEIDLERAGVPVSFQQIVRQCLEKEPENRFQSARDLAVALDTLKGASGGQPRRLKAQRWQVRW